MKKIVTLLSFLLFGLFTAKAITFTEDLLFVAAMQSSSVVPETTGEGKGVASFLLNGTRDTLAVNIGLISMSGNATSVGIYSGEIGELGIQVVDLSAFISNNKVTTYITGTQLDEILINLFNETLYVQVTSDANPLGEIRGQINLERDLNYVASLTGLEVVPELIGFSYGLGSFSLNHEAKNLNFNIVLQELSSPLLSVKLYSGAKGENGSEVADLTAFAAGNLVSGQIIPAPEMLDELYNKHIYLLISTDAHPEGELRAQLENFKGLSFDAVVDGAQMVPAIVTPAKGVCVIRLSPAMDTLFYDIVLDNINSAIDYAHLHIGEYGLAYGALQVDFSSAINGNSIKGIKTSLGVSESTITKLLTSNLTLIVHTGDYPGGEIRGQIVRYARKGFVVNLEGSQVVSPVATSAYGNGIVSISRNEDNLHYNFVAGGLESEATGSYLSNNIFGQNGPIIYDASTNLLNNGFSVSANGYWRNTDLPSFLPNNSNQIINDSVYLWIANINYPEGELRGQIGDCVSCLETTSIDFAADYLSSPICISPNPSDAYIHVSFQLDHIEVVEVMVVNLLGEIISKQSMTNSGGNFSVLINTADYAPGTYFVQIEYNGLQTSKPFIKY